MITSKKLFGVLSALLLSGSAWATDLSYGVREQWIATWGAAPMAPTSAGQPEQTFENQTIRQIVHISAGGPRVRVRLSNAFGTQPLRIGAAHVALQSSDATIVPASDRTLKFSGQASINIPAGAVALSDPVDLAVAARADLAISIYLPVNTGPATYHDSANQTAYISSAGDFSAATTLPVAATKLSRYFLSVVEISSPRKINAVITIGDSITEGFRSTDNANHRWPDYLSTRVNSRYGRPQLGVVNQGIGCGRLLYDFCGPNGAGRFDRDILAVSGATHIISALGLVDIILPTSFGIPDQILSAAEIITGLRQLIERAHEKGLIIYGATIMPFGANTFPGVFTPENEAKRQAVNRWIRTSNAFDAVIDFDATMRDPHDPTKIWAMYVSDDGIHPNDAGYEVMANSIDLSLFD